MFKVTLLDTMQIVHISLGVFFSICFAILFFRMISKDKKENELIRKKTGVSKYKEEHFKRNWHWVLLWCGIIFCALGILYCFNVFHLEDEKDYVFSSKVDSIIWLMTVIGIVGAIWALFARIDAEKAFKGTNKILDALGTTFPFDEILNPDQAIKIIESIGKENCDVSLFIGFPIIGYLYNEKAKFNVTPEHAFMRLSNRVDDLKTNTKNFKFSVSVFPKKITCEILKKYCKENNVSAVDKKNIAFEIDGFYKRLTLINNRKNIVIDSEMGANENLRFASLKFLILEEDFANKSIVWIVKNLKGSNVSFNSYCFQSNDANLSSVLQNVFQ